MKIAVFADGNVGLSVLKTFKKNSKTIDFLVINDNVTDKYKKEILQSAEIGQWFFYSEFLSYLQAQDKNEKIVDLGILAWWPHLIGATVLDTARLGFINFHPSFLPYGRGKHPNFWTFIENTQFGVSLHWVDSTIDGGDIAFQQHIEKDWLDTGETLYVKSLAAIVELFDKNFTEIVSARIPRVAQKPNIVHFSKDLDAKSQVYLEDTYVAKDLLNLLRARTFEGFPSCWFLADGKKYEIKIDIKEV